MLNTYEMDTIAEIKARVLAKQPVSDREKQLMLDLVRREGLGVRSEVIQRARNSGFNIQGIKTL